MNRRLTIAWILFVTWLIISGCEKEQKLGGSDDVSVTDKEVVAAAAFAIEAQENAMQDPEDGEVTHMELVKILGATKQVVAGMNYRLDLQVKVDGQERKAEALVWLQSWRTPDPYQLTSWTWNDQANH